MKRTSFLTLFCLLQLSLLATDGIRFESLKWAEIKAKAAKENKMIFLDAFASWCGPCKYMEENIYTEEKTASYFNDHFINVKIDMEEGEGPALADEFNVTAYPTFLFFTPDGKLVHKYVGAMEAEKFIELGKDASNPERQYFTLKEKATALDLSDADFRNWAAMAERFDDDDKEGIITKYLASRKDLLANKDIATIVTSYSTLTEENLAFLFHNRTRLKTVMEWDEEKLATELYNLLYARGIKAYTSNNNSVEAYLNVFRKFDPASVELARKEILYKIEVIVKKDFSSGLSMLAAYLKDQKAPVKLETIGTWMFDHADDFEKAALTSFNTVLASFRFRPMDKGKEYWLYLMQMLTWSKLGEEARAKEFALKAYKHENIPEEFKEVLGKNYGVGEDR